MRQSRTFILGAATYIFGSTATFVYIRSRKDSVPCTCVDGNVWDSLADSYDSRISLDETVMGLRLLRRYVVRQAKVHKRIARSSTSPSPPPSSCVVNSKQGRL